MHSQAAAKEASPLPSDINGETEDFFRRAKELFAKDQFSAAIPLLQRAVRLTPNSAVIRRYLGYAFWRSNANEKAREELQTALHFNPKDPYTLYFLARIAEAQGRVEEAVRCYHAEIVLGLPVYDTYQRLGQAYANQGQLEKAQEMVEQALQQTPWDGGLHYQLGRIYEKAKRPKEAQEEFHAATRLGQNDQASIQKLLEISVALRKGNLYRVFQLREELLKQTPVDPEIMDSLGIMLAHARLYADALGPLQRAAHMLPQSYEASYGLGLTLLKLRRFKEAEASLKKAIEIQPDSFEANSSLAIIYVDRGQSQDAIAALCQASKIQPNNASVLALLGQQYLQGHHLEQAVSTLQEALRLGGNKREVLYLLIEAYGKLHEFENAYKTAVKTLSLYPSDARATYEVGHQLASLGKYEEARPYAEKAIHIDPSLAGGYTLLGYLDLQEGEYERGLAKFQKARKSDARSLAALRGIGESLIRLKRYSEAVTELKGSVKLFPDNPGLHYVLSQAYMRVGDQDMAKHEIRIVRKLRALQRRRLPPSFDLTVSGRKQPVP